MTNDLTSVEMDEEALQAGEKLLWVGLIATVIMIFALIKNIVAIAFPCIIASFWGAMSGISQVSRGLGTNTAVKYLALVLGLIPGVNLMAIAYFLVRARGARQQAHAEIARQNALERSRQRAIERQSNSATAETAAIAKNPRQTPLQAAPEKKNESVSLANALPYIKLAGLGGMAEGERLQVGMGQAGIDIPEKDLPVARASKGEFGVFYVIDSGEGLAYVNLGQLQSAGATMDELHGAGLRNLKALIKSDKNRLRLVQQGGAIGLIMDGNFEASLVLVDELWDGALKKHAPNGPIVAVPARDICAFCDANSQEGIADLKRIIERVWKNGDHLISDRLFARKNGQWVAS